MNSWLFTTRDVLDINCVRPPDIMADRQRKPESLQKAVLTSSFQPSGKDVLVLKITYYYDLPLWYNDHWDWDYWQTVNINLVCSCSSILVLSQILLKLQHTACDLAYYFYKQLNYDFSTKLKRKLKLITS